MAELVYARVSKTRGLKNLVGSTPTLPTKLMLSVTELRNGTVFQEKGEPWIVLNYEHIKMGRGSANVKVKSRNLRTGHISEKSFISNARVEEADVDKVKATYLYQDNQNFNFMAKETFEQFSIPQEVIGEGVKFLKEEMEVVLLIWEGSALNVELPKSVELSVAETGPGIKGDSVSNVLKPATLENGLTINVPLFIHIGDKVRIDTKSGEYIERVTPR